MIFREEKTIKKTDYSISVLQKRLFAVCLAITFLFCIFVGRFFYIQVVWGDDLNDLAAGQWTREIPVVAERGKIFDANGELLAGNETAYSVFARANAVTDPEGASRFLSAFLPLSYEELLAKLKDKSKSEISVLRHTDKQTVSRIEGSGFTGIYYSRDNTRIYPFGDLACQLLGFTSVDQTGATGVEQYYNEYLAGQNGDISYETDLVGAEIGNAPLYLPATAGLNVRLTVDYRIQALAEEVMARTLAQTSAKAVRCIILDPSDFKILALVNLPSYDLNQIPRDDLQTLNELSRNSVVCDIYEPGSTFKIITAAADLEEHFKGNPAAYSPDYIFPASGTRSVDGTTIKCWAKHADGRHANQTLADALNNSCNPCFTDMALALGRETFYSYLKAFRFGSATGIDCSGESVGMLLPESTVRDCDLARIGFGQTIAVSPLQLACAAASAVNGGNYYSPRIVSEIFSDDGSVRIKVTPSFVGKTVSEQTSRLLAQMLEGVVRDGSGKKAYIEGYKVAGKTGTAQKYENGHIAQGKYVSSFVGFFPSDNPRYLGLFIVDEPQGTYYGSAIAAPCAEEIFRGIIGLKQIRPYEEGI